MSVTIDKSKWPKSLTIGGASVGGVYYVYGGAWSKIVEKVTGITTGLQVTGGPNQNIQLMELGDIQLGMTTMGPAYEALNGLEAWTKGQKFVNFRGLFPMYNTYSFWWVFEHTGIRNIRDLENMVVGVGPVGGTPGTYHPLFLQELGIRPKAIRHAGASALVSQHLDRQIEANSFASGVPVAAVSETAAHRKVRIFGVEGADRDKIVARWPFWTPAVIPAKVFGDWQDYEIQTVGMWNMAIAHKNLPDDLVYTIVKGVFENTPMLIAATKSAEETQMQFITNNTFMPMHPGAIKFFEDNGIKIPANLYPPEYKK
ncbi:MAG: TAXI family TRAP transporter solute-binding subunit [Bacillota bacterium]